MSTENTITTAEKDFAAAPNATLDELVGTTTNTALLPEPDAHAYDEIATGDADPLILGGHKFTSRFILGSGRYDLNLIIRGCEPVLSGCRSAGIFPNLGGTAVYSVLKRFAL